MNTTSSEFSTSEFPCVLVHATLEASESKLALSTSNTLVWIKVHADSTSEQSYISTVAFDSTLWEPNKVEGFTPIAESFGVDMEG